MHLYLRTSKRVLGGGLKDYILLVDGVCAFVQPLTHWLIMDALFFVRFASAEVWAS